MQAYNKAIGALLGALVGVGFSFAAVHGVGDGSQIYGLTQADVLAILTPLGAVVSTYLFPANKPNA